VSDRRRLCSECPAATVIPCVLRQVQWAVEAQVDFVQIRERELPSSELAALVVESVARARGSATRVIVNDRLDVALACGAAGVHLRADSAPASTVRHSVPSGFLVGQSVHTVEEAAAVESHVDYLIAGTVWPSASKERAGPFLGTDGLANIARAVNVPVLAIGGVDSSRFAAVALSGAAGVAAIGLFLGDGPTAPCRAVPLTQIVQAARAV
jgi:thiamine-phosphate diphosphorylase